MSASVDVSRTQFVDAVVDLYVELLLLILDILINSSSGLEEKKENVITEIVKQSAKPMITDLMLNTGLEYTLKAKAYYITLNIAVGPKCHKEFKFSYDWFTEDYEYAKDWIKGIQPGPMK